MFLQSFFRGQANLATLPSSDSNLPIKLYGDLLIKILCNTIYCDPSIDQWSGKSYQENVRATGRDWPSTAHSMIGIKRMESLRTLTELVLAEGIPGDLIETGVWRGGACILMRGLLAAHGVTMRKVVVADSFQGLPQPNDDSYPADVGAKFHTYSELAISLENVKENFAKYGLLDDQVEFLQGWFKDTLPTLRNRTFALMRLDGDMYESTLDGLNNLYDRLSPGGVIIIDDYGALASCRQAVNEFRSERGIDTPLEKTDWTAVWWRKPM